eukprot:TRINITY_DN15414_c0_g1_i1.p2 TRINITY_DN15414_c0_g1~~TRINITY_DN15414_c0_g1_i1.p2  ORF type:complete len:172 (+),score=35.48 TRINITY_DN15414_c0_g1_i1:31-546(+)
MRVTELRQINYHGLPQFFFSNRRRHTMFLPVSWARRCVQETGTWDLLELEVDDIVGFMLLSFRYALLIWRTLYAYKMSKQIQENQNDIKLDQFQLVDQSMLQKTVNDLPEFEINTEHFELSTENETEAEWKENADDSQMEIKRNSGQQLLDSKKYTSFDEEIGFGENEKSN